MSAGLLFGLAITWWWSGAIPSNTNIVVTLLMFAVVHGVETMSQNSAIADLKGQAGAAR